MSLVLQLARDNSCTR